MKNDYVDERPVDVTRVPYCPVLTTVLRTEHAPAGPARPITHKPYAYPRKFQYLGPKRNQAPVTTRTQGRQSAVRSRSGWGAGAARRAEGRRSYRPILTTHTHVACCARTHQCPVTPHTPPTNHPHHPHHTHTTPTPDIRRQTPHATHHTHHTRTHSFRRAVTLQAPGPVPTTGPHFTPIHFTCPRPTPRGHQRACCSTCSRTLSTRTPLLAHIFPTHYHQPVPSLPTPRTPLPPAPDFLRHDMLRRIAPPDRESLAGGGAALDSASEDRLLRLDRHESVRRSALPDEALAGAIPANEQRARAMLCGFVERCHCCLTCCCYRDGRAPKALPARDCRLGSVHNSKLSIIASFANGAGV